MILKQSIQQVFVQLSQSLNELSNDEYGQPSKVLLNATIGEHVRHIIELFQCLEKGYDTGTVNYEKRKRDHEIENNKELASSLLKEIYFWPNSLKHDRHFYENNEYLDILLHLKLF